MTKPHIEQIKSALFEALLDRFEPMGFKYVKSEDAIKRTLKDRVEKVVFHFYYYHIGDNTTEIEPRLSVENKAISKVYKKCSAWAKEYLKGKVNSLGNSLTEIYQLEEYAPNNKDFGEVRWSIRNDEDIQEWVPRIVEAVEIVALPYFEKYGSIEKIEEVLNDKVEFSKHRVLNPLRFSHGLIAAKILEKQNLKELVSRYKKYFEEHGIDEQWGEDFNRVVEEITSHNKTYSA
jgi:hypothetical protein